MNVTMKIEGLEPLRRMAAKAPRIVDTEAKAGVRKSAIILRHRAIRNAKVFSIGDRFPRSIRYKIERGGLGAIVGSLAPTALSIEEGRRVGEVVPFGKIIYWIQRRGIVRGIFNISTQKIARRINVASRTKAGARRAVGIRQAERAEAARIVALIKSGGTKALPFLIPAAQAEAQQVKAVFRDVVRSAMQKLKAA